MTVRAFRRKMWSYYQAHGRHDLPWRPPSLKLRRDKKTARDPYRVLVSEVMLQQTQVPRVREYYPRFIRLFPDFEALSRAPLREVLVAWQGLGYNRRALYLKRTAEAVIREHGGRLPEEVAVLRTLPGIGPNTAGSIAAFAWNQPVVFIETNIRRAFIHHFFPKRRSISDAELLPIIAATLRHSSGSRGVPPREWYSALMDYGAMLGTKISKRSNPNRRSRQYAKQSRFEGSTRRIRGIVLRFVLQRPRSLLFLRRTARDPRLNAVLRGLVRDRLLVRHGNTFAVV